MWQNGGMSGLDQWNFVMHPIDAAMTCDPKGDFVRKWIPVLSKLPDQFVHCPWKCPTTILSKSGVVIGQNYPERVIKNLDMAREASLADVAKLRQQSPDQIDPHSGSSHTYIRPSLYCSADQNSLKNMLPRGIFGYSQGNIEGLAIVASTFHLQIKGIFGYCDFRVQGELH